MAQRSVMLRTARSQPESGMRLQCCADDRKTRQPVGGRRFCHKLSFGPANLSASRYSAIDSFALFALNGASSTSPVFRSGL